MKTDDIGKYLRKLRQENNLTQKELAGQLHVTHQAVSRWENGKSIPDIDTLSRLGDKYGITIDEILLKENASVVVVKKKNKVFLRYLIVYFGIIGSLFGISLFLNFEFHYTSHIFFTGFITVLITVFMLSFKIKAKLIEYSVITGLIIVVFIVLLGTNFGYYLIDQVPYQTLIEEKEVDIELSDEVKFLRYTHIFDECKLVYTYGEENMYLLNVSNFSEDIITLDTDGKTVRDVVVVYDDIYYTSWEEETTFIFNVYKMNVETNTSELVFEGSTILNMYEIFPYDIVLFVTNPEYSQETNVYTMDVDEEMTFISDFSYQVYDVISYQVDYQTGYLFSIKNISGPEMLYEENYNLVWANDQFEISESLSFFDDELVIPAIFEGDFGEIYFENEDQIYFMREADVELVVREDNFADLQSFGGNHYYMDGEILNKDFSVYSKFLFYDYDYTKSSTYYAFTDDSGNSFAFDNHYFALLQLHPYVSQIWLLHPVLRFLILVPSMFSLGYFIVLGQRKGK